ncbi:hypothetical protein L5M38_22200 [Shewanella sp. SM101]|jgi:hypothetical protein|uniref:hypothetical protein n=1 Tax=Shewanella TaxID=22 RepID=UPI0002112E49|nr:MULTISPECIES: hypothetical protein [Shewanella]AEH16256.1 hypothetical protein Sbal117_4618 [Shewanella baltica OS117]MCU8008984.1 hypothetical protein [Shewanella sp. SM87]MCU8107220.1 hypothetical protein [Shewanella sp. SM101]
MSRFNFKNPLAPMVERKRCSKVKSPLVNFIEKIPPRLRGCFVGVTIDSRLGYTGKRQFHSLSQALMWAESECGHSWADKRFLKPISLETLLDCTAMSVPESVQASLKWI